MHGQASQDLFLLIGRPPDGYNVSAATRCVVFVFKPVRFSLWDHMWLLEFALAIRIQTVKMLLRRKLYPSGRAVLWLVGALLPL